LKDSPAKKKILGEFRMMEDFETSTRDFYLRVAADPRVDRPEIKRVFESTAEEEKKHIGLVREIMNIVESSL
jgi:rubrerythrin